MQRQSNNFRPQFTDEECITVYLWIISQRRFEQKAIYNYTKNHLSEWFPDLPRYQAFSRRCAALAPAFRDLAERWIEQAAPSGETQTIYMVDSCPIMLAHRSRSGYAKVAGDLCAKSYNSTRKEWPRGGFPRPDTGFRLAAGQHASGGRLDQPFREAADPIWIEFHQQDTFQNFSYCPPLYIAAGSPGFAGCAAFCITP